MTKLLGYSVQRLHHLALAKDSTWHLMQQSEGAEPPPGLRGWKAPSVLGAGCGQMGYTSGSLAEQGQFLS